MGRQWESQGRTAAARFFRARVRPKITAPQPASVPNRWYTEVNLVACSHVLGG
jgi:hypothetical protein